MKSVIINSPLESRTTDENVLTPKRIPTMLMESNGLMYKRDGVVQHHKTSAES